jgi:S1-C subfamily serine protease
MAVAGLKRIKAATAVLRVIVCALFLLPAPAVAQSCVDSGLWPRLEPLYRDWKQASEANHAKNYALALSLVDPVITQVSVLRLSPGVCGTQIEQLFEVSEKVKAATLFGLKKFADALRIYRELATACRFCDRTKKAEYYTDLGSLLALTERLQEAEQAYRSAVSLNPDDPGVYVGLGQLYEMLGQRQAAAGIYRRALQVAGTAEGDREVVELARKALARLASAHAAPSNKPPSAPTAGPKLAATGTGFVVSASGDVLTNNHVVARCKEVRAGPDDGDASKATISALDRQNDLALLKLSSPPAATARFREENTVRLGEAVVVLGFPLYALVSKGMSLTTGNVSALVGIRDDRREIQITAPVQPGNSGGPLVDTSGNVIGIVSATLNAIRTAEATGDIPQNINFAIRGSVVRQFLDSKKVTYRTAPSGDPMKTADIADAARGFTLRIECWN